MIIRLANQSDSHTVAELSNQLGYPCHVSEVAERIAWLSAQDRGALFVCEQDGSTAGWVQVDEILVICEPPYAEISGLVVAEQKRNQGIGSKLLLHVEKWAQDRGLQIISVRSNVIREQAHQFYLNNGYKLKKSQHTFTKGLFSQGEL